MKEFLLDLYEDEPLLFYLMMFSVGALLMVIVLASLAEPAFGLLVIVFAISVWSVSTLVKKWIGVK